MALTTATLVANVLQTREDRHITRDGYHYRSLAAAAPSNRGRTVCRGLVRCAPSTNDDETKDRKGEEDSETHQRSCRERNRASSSSSVAAAILQMCIIVFLSPSPYAITPRHLDRADPPSLRIERSASERRVLTLSYDSLPSQTVIFPFGRERETLGRPWKRPVNTEYWGSISTAADSEEVC